MNMKEMLYTLWQKKLDEHYFDEKQFLYTNLPKSAGNFEVLEYRVSIRGSLAQATMQVKTLKSFGVGVDIVNTTLPTVPEGVPTFAAARSVGWIGSALVVGQMTRDTLWMRPFTVAIPANQILGVTSISVLT